MKIEEIDKNFSVTKIGDDEFEFLDVLQPPFALEGLPFADRPGDGAPYFRVPNATLDGILQEHKESMCSILSRCTTGAAVRFRAKTKQIAIRYTTRESWDMNHMPRSGSAGFDLYRIVPGDMQYRFYGSVQPTNTSPELVFSVSGEEVIARGNGLPNDEECEYMLNLPLYGGVSKLELGFPPDAVILPPRPHRVSRPICFYGSSITQGGCASRPGNNYCSLLCRAVDAEQINLGFSGNAWGEKAMADLIAELDLSCFVLDYDHNAPNVEHLEKTHERFFKIVRAAHPDLPIIILSKCDVDHRECDLHNKRRREVVMQTYLNAVAAGDRRVWFVDGRELLGTEDRDACSVDGCHPNDLGFYRMFKAVLPVLKEALKS